MKIVHSYEIRNLFFIFFILLLVLKINWSLHLTTLISQNGIHGEITFYQDPLSDGKIIKQSIYITVNLFHRNKLEDNETWTWFISEFPVDYSTDLQKRCSSEMIGNLVIDLGELFGPILFTKELNQTYFEFETKKDIFSLVEDKGIWGYSLVLLGPKGQKSCGTISVTDEYEEKVAEAKFQYPVFGSVYFRWAGSYKHNVTGSIIYSKLIHMTNHANSQHGWKIYVTDIFDSEADSIHDNCDFLQIVLNPSNSNKVLGDLTSRLGKITIVNINHRNTRASKSLFRDRELSLLPTDLIEGGRSLYLVLFDDQHDDSFLACSKIRQHNHVAAKAIIQSKGLTGAVTFSQRTRFDPTWVLFNISILTKKKIIIEGCQINELVANDVMNQKNNECSATGRIYNPTGADKKHGSSDVYAVGDLSGKYGNLQYIGSIMPLWDINLPLFGPNSIIHRSLVFYRKNHKDLRIPWLCGTIIRYSSNAESSSAIPMLTATSVFRYPIVGSIVFRQPKDQPWIDTTVIVEYLIYADGINVNNSFNHEWSINEYAPGMDFFNWTGRCLSSGGIFNLFKTDFDLNKTEYQCKSNNLELCRVGDLSGKAGFLSIAGSKAYAKNVSQKVLTIENLPLSGSSSVIGKSLVIYDRNGPAIRGNRLACSKILPTHRRKGIAKSWHDNGFSTLVSGKFEFLQQSKYDVTNIKISVEGLVDVLNYQIHVAPVEEQLEFPCEDSTIYGQFNPFKLNTSKFPVMGTPDEYEVGDLSRKFETFENKTTVVSDYIDSSMTLFGSNSILGRSIVIFKKIKNRRWVCSSIERGYSPFEAREIRAIVSFHHPKGFAYGYIRISQLVYNDESKSDSIIEVNLRYPGEQDRNLTKNHKWAIYVNPVSVDATVKVLNTRCTAGGYIWNPYFIQLADPLNEELYQKECGPDNPFRCYVGDISGRLGTINLGDKRQIFSDINFPLEGKVSAMGRSIVIFAPEGGNSRFACANIEPDKNILKYANIRRSPKFVTAHFLNELRDIMGVPEWFITIDSRKTKILFNGNCIQFLFYFRGPEANKLEQDFNKLLTTGKLFTPSLYIPGYSHNNKRKTTLSYGLCEFYDPQEGKKNKKKNFSYSSSSGTVLMNFLIYLFAYLLLF